MEVSGKFDTCQENYGAYSFRGRSILFPFQYNSVCWTSVTNSNQPFWNLPTKFEWLVLAVQDCPELGYASAFTSLFTKNVTMWTVPQRPWMFIQLPESISSSLRTDSAVISCCSFVLQPLLCQVFQINTADHFWKLPDEISRKQDSFYCDLHSEELIEKSALN